MGTNYNPQIVTNGLTVCLDPANSKSYKFSENLLIYSQQFNLSPWSLGGTGTPSITANTTTAPDGTITASTLYGNAGIYSNRIQQTITVTPNTYYNFSFYIKNKDNANASIFHISFPSSGKANSEAYLFWTGNTISGYSNTGTTQPKANYITDGWYRVSMSVSTNTSDSGGAIVRIYPSSNDGTIYNNVYIWGAQVERSNTSNPYITTTTTSVSPPNTVIDLSGKGNYANSSSMPTFSSNNNGCFSFNGNQFALLPTNYFGSLDQSSKTVCLFFNTSTLSRSGLCGTRDLVAGGWSFVLNRVSPGTLTYGNIGIFNNEVSAGITTDQWYQACFTYDTANTLSTLYLNGVNISTYNFSGVGMNLSQNPQINFGTENGVGAGGTPLIGYMGAIQVYNRALSNTEILQNFNALRGRYGI